jgi:hypothetical protein
VIQAKDSTSKLQGKNEGWALRACRNEFGWSVGPL